MALDLGSRITELRSARGLSQEALANELGLSRQAVSRWERGEALPDTENLIALADLFEVTLDELVRPAVRQTAPTQREPETPDATEAEPPSPAEDDAETEPIEAITDSETPDADSDAPAMEEDMTETADVTTDLSSAAPEADTEPDAYSPTMPPEQPRQGFWTTTRMLVAAVLALLFIVIPLVVFIGTKLFSFVNNATSETAEFESALLEPNSHADIDGTLVSNLDITSAAGSIYLERDEGTAGGNVRIFETFGDNGTSIEVPAWSLEDGTLHIQPGPGREHDQNSQLYIYVPYDVMINMRDISVDVGSGEFMTSGVVCRSFELDVESGSAYAHGLEADELDVECESGYAMVNCWSVRDMDIQVESGTADVIVEDVLMPASIEAGVAAGELVFHFPDECGFTVTEEQPHANVSYGFNMTFNGSNATYGTGTTQITVSTDTGLISFMPV